MVSGNSKKNRRKMSTEPNRKTSVKKAARLFWDEVVEAISRLQPHLTSPVDRVARFRQTMRAHGVPDSQLYHCGEVAIAQAIIDQEELGDEDLMGTNRPPPFKPCAGRRK